MTNHSELQLEQRNFRADPLLLKRLRIQFQYSIKDLVKATELSKQTVSNIMSGKPVFLNSLGQFAETAFGITNPLEILHPDELVELGVSSPVQTENQVAEWQIERYLSDWKKTSNGLQYQTVKLRHRFLESRFARGKCYELRHLSSVDREAALHNLQRHPEVCEAAESRHVASNLSVVQVHNLWWVIDRMEEGDWLAQRLKLGPMSCYEIKIIMSGIAKGLSALHKVGVICRELNPDSVILRESNDQPVITDLELAKLIGHAKSVSPSDWPDDPYRALEVGDQQAIDARADLYSWGRIFFHCFMGSLPERGDEPLIKDAGIPKRISDFVFQCVAATPKKRPPEIGIIIKDFEKWVA